VNENRPRNLRDHLEAALPVILEHAKVDQPPPEDEPFHVVMGPIETHSTPPEEGKPASIQIEPKGPVVLLVGPALVKRAELLVNLAAHHRYAQKFSEKWFAQYLDAAIRNIAISGATQAEAIADQIDGLLRDLDGPEREWETVSPIQNLVLPADMPVVERSTFRLVRPTQQATEELRHKVSTAMDASTSPAEVKEQLNPAIWAGFNEKQPATWCFTNVRAGDWDMAFERGHACAREVAAVMQVGLVYVMDPYRIEQYRPWVALAGEVHEGRRWAFGWRSGGFDVKSASTGRLAPAHYSRDAIVAWQKDAHGLWDALDTPPTARTEMQTRLVEACTWCGRGMRADSDAEKIVHYSMATELLLAPTVGAGGLTHVAAERSAILLGSTPEQRIKVEKAVRDLYALRGDLVHGRQPDIDPHKAVRFYRIIFLLLLAVGEHIEEYGRSSDFAEWVDQRRWQCPTEE